MPHRMEGQESLRDKRRSMSDYRRHRLQIQADVIRNTFAGRGIAVHVGAGTRGPGATRFVIEGAAAVSHGSSLEKALRHNLNCNRLGMSWWQGRLLLDVPALPEPSVNLLEMLEAVPLLPYVAALGWSEDARPVLLNFAGEDTGHILLLGDANAGKTSLMRTCAASLAMGSRQSHIQLVFIDARYSGDKPSGTCLGALQYLPHALARPVSTVGRIGQLLDFLAEEWRHRRRYHIEKPRIVVFVDGAGTLLRRGGSVIEEPMRLLLEQGALSGIHMIMSTRVSTASDLERLTALKPLLRIYGWSDRSQANGAGSVRQPAFTRELLGKGDFVASYGDDTVRFQAAYLNAYDLHYCLENLQRRRPPSILAHPTRACSTLPAAAGASQNRTLATTPAASPR